MRIDKIEVDTTVKNGKANRNRESILSAFKAFEGQDVTLTIQKRKHRRTSPQNRWYWGVVVELVYLRLRELGNHVTKNDTHQLIKLAVARYNKELIADEVVNNQTGEVLGIKLRSTSSFDKEEFNEYKLIIQQWGAEVLDIDIPDPDEQLTFEI